MLPTMVVIEPKDIAKVRRQLGLTQSQLSSVSQVSQSYIARIESGKIDPSYSKTRALSDALKNIQRKI